MMSSPILRTSSPSDWQLATADPLSFRHGSTRLLDHVEGYSGICSLLRPPTGDDFELRNPRRLDEFYVFGAGKVAEQFLLGLHGKHCRVKGVLDNDSSKRSRAFCGETVLSPQEVELRGCDVVIASGRYQREITDQVLFYGGRPIYVHEAQVLLQCGHQRERSFSNYGHSLRQNWQHVVTAFLCLNDERSRRVFDALIEFRLNAVQPFPDPLKDPVLDEYLCSDFVAGIRTGESVVDVGAYDGDAFDRFENKYGAVETAYLFEPEIAPYRKSLDKYIDRGGIFSFNVALGVGFSKLRYHGESSFDLKTNFSIDQQQLIQTMPLDSLQIQHPKFIKIDTEGGGGGFAGRQENY